MKSHFFMYGNSPLRGIEEGPPCFRLRGILAGAPRMRRPGQNPAPGGGAIAPELVYGGVGGGVLRFGDGLGRFVPIPLPCANKSLAERAKTVTPSSCCPPDLLI